MPLLEYLALSVCAETQRVLWCSLQYKQHNSAKRFLWENV